MAPLRAAALPAASVLSRRPATLFWPRLAVRAAVAAVAGAKAGDRRRPAPRSARQPCRMDGAPHRDIGLGVMVFRLDRIKMCRRLCLSTAAVAPPAARRMAESK